MGDRGVVAVSEIFGRVGDWRERSAEGVDELVVDVPGELVGEVGLGGVHGRSMTLIRFTVISY
jgi:hypothetical protein